MTVATYQDAFDALWKLQRDLEEQHLDTPETTAAVVKLDKLLHESENAINRTKPVQKEEL